MLPLLRQIAALTRKTLLIVVVRHPVAILIRAIIIPLVIVLIIAFAQQFFNTPETYGVGPALPVLSLQNALALDSKRSKVGFVDNGMSGGNISSVIDSLSKTFKDAGKTVEVYSDSGALSEACKGASNGASSCFTGITFLSSPTEPRDGGTWNYTIRGDSSLGGRTDVKSSKNDAQIYLFPIQRAVDRAILSRSSSVDQNAIPAITNNMQYTPETEQTREDTQRRSYLEAAESVFGAFFYFATMDIIYHLAGFVSSERELGMAQLIDAMIPGTALWKSRLTRMLSTHIAFSSVYFPSWLAVGIILAVKVFTNTNGGIIIIYHVLVGLANCSFAMLGSVFFKRSQLSGSVLMLVAVVLCLLPQFLSARKQTQSTVIALSLFFPFSNYTYFITSVARWELGKEGMNLAKVAPESPYKVCGIFFWIFLILQTVVYPILASFIEKMLWGTTSSRRRARSATSSHDAPLQLRNFSKTYSQHWVERLFLLQKKKSDVHAVKNLNLDARKGQICMLLGPNGSGKSTTLDAIAGLTKVTGGTIDVDTTGGLGIAPQKNVLWDDLTVKEHIEIFAALKFISPLEPGAEVEKLIDACDLRNKLGAKAKTLSGGQKRKLQLAMMFAGGSAVCCIDEVSSGLDPLSRRKIWDILLAERGNRTIIMTTHFLDEADFLADDIAILSKGDLKARGSSAELKYRLGDGYSVHITDTSNLTLPADIEAPKTEAANRVTYQVSDSTHAAELIGKLERDRIYNYHVSGPTIEELFLKMTEDPSEIGSSDTYLSSVTEKDAGDGAVMGRSAASDISLRNGRKISLWKQGWLLFRKRLTIFRRSYMPYFTAVALALIGAGISPAVIEDFKRLPCPQHGAQSDSSSYGDYEYSQSLADEFSGSYAYAKMVIGPRSKISNDTLRLISDTYSQNHTYGSYSGIGSFDLFYGALVFVDTLDEFDQYIQGHAGDVTPGGVFLSDPPTFSWASGGYLFPGGMFMQNIADILLTRIPISTAWSAFGQFGLAELFDFNSLIFTVIFGLVFSAYPAFFALYPTNERLRKMRAMQYSNGVRSFPLWLAYLSFDGMFIIIISVVATILLAVGSSVWYSLPMIFVVLLLYGISSALLGYVLSMFAPSSLAAWAFSSVGQIVMYFAYFGALLGIQANTGFTDLASQLDKLQFGLALISPIANVERTILIGLGLFATTCGDTSYPGAITLYGGPILYLILQSLVLLCVLLWWDSGVSPLALFRRRKIAQAHEESSVSSADDEFALEIARVDRSTEGLRVKHLTKKFKTLAVDDLTFSIHSGEIFGLLGPNGAGKTTVISLIRGDISPSTRDSSIKIDRASVLTQRATARSLLGVCPQFDCADNMTVTSNLIFFARIRGVGDPAHNVAQVIIACGLTAWAHQLASTLSGGTKRKLSLAIALVGNPRALLLDEPSSGLDAKAKRTMWATLSTVAKDRAVLLTTHSMEEADALAHRVGIMSARMLALGTSDDMRRRGGDVYHVHLVLASAPHTTHEETESVKGWVQEYVPGARIERETYGGQVRFSVAKAEGRVSVGDLFRVLEAKKEELGIGYYSVGRTTLDEVFVGVVREHGGKEEGSAEVEEKKGLFRQRK